MLGLLLIYFIWKYYSDLALEYNKNKWGYALLGIASYYAGAFMGGVILAVIGMLINSDFVSEMNSLVLNLVALPFGLLAVWGLYTLLKKKWSVTSYPGNDSLDADLLTPNRED